MGKRDVRSGPQRQRLPSEDHDAYGGDELSDGEEAASSTFWLKKILGHAFLSGGLLIGIVFIISPPKSAVSGVLSSHNSPGGLVGTTRSIVQGALESNLPAHATANIQPQHPLASPEPSNLRDSSHHQHKSQAFQPPPPTATSPSRLSPSNPNSNPSLLLRPPRLPLQSRMQPPPVSFPRVRQAAGPRKRSRMASVRQRVTKRNSSVRASVGARSSVFAFSARKLVMLRDKALSRGIDHRVLPMRRQFSYFADVKMLQFFSDHYPVLLLLPWDILRKMGVLKVRDPTKAKFTFISHQWCTREHPFPDALQMTEHISGVTTPYIWLDWYCAPQWTRLAGTRS